MRHVSQSTGRTVATDQAIAACGGDVRAALRAMIVANEQLRASISNGHACGSLPRERWCD
jgi:hypothetical protein